MFVLNTRAEKLEKKYYKRFLNPTKMKRNRGKETINIYSWTRRGLFTLSDTKNCYLLWPFDPNESREIKKENIHSFYKNLKTMLNGSESKIWFLKNKRIWDRDIFWKWIKAFKCFKEKEKKNWTIWIGQNNEKREKIMKLLY